MEKILLSFCIPTYNRVNKLKECIKNIQKIKSENIEIIVSDNFSTDNTREEIQKLQVNDKRIKYTRNQSNIGFVKNVVKVLKEGNGKYLYLISDEDFVVSDEIIKNLKTKLFENEYDAILGSIYDIKSNCDYLKYKKSYEELDRKKALKLFFNRKYISGTIYNKKKINFDVLEKYLDDEGNMYPQLLALFMMVEGMNKIKIIKENICYLRNEEEPHTNNEQKMNKKSIPYYSPVGRIEQLKFMLKFINNEVKDIRIKKELYRIYGKEYSELYKSILFSGIFLGKDYQKEKKYFFNEVVKLKEIKGYFLIYNYYYLIKNIIRKVR